MKDRKNADDIPQSQKPSSGRVLVHLVNAKPRPLISLTGCLNMHRPADWFDIGFEAWQSELNRRKQIHALMTEDERDFFDKYCRLRDD